MKHKIQLVKETKEDGSLVFFIKINDQTKTAHYDFEEAVAKYNYYAELYQPAKEEVIMETEIDY
jgi:type I site-specific restriction-modification system R (restriction) subunit